MPRMTLLEMTQNVLSAMDSDEVNSISDTVESLQVAQAIIDTYYELLNNLNIPSREGIVHLDPSNSADLPCVMYIPKNVRMIKWIKYNDTSDVSLNYSDVTYAPPEDFVNIIMPQTINQTVSVATMSLPNGTKIPVFNDTQPRYYTTFDNNMIIFDAYNASLDSTLQSSKTLCWGEYDPVFALDDSAVPQLDINNFSYLLAEAKSSCFVNFKQVSNSKEEQKAKRQRMRSQKDRWLLDQRRPYNRLPDYGRKP